MFFIVFLMFSPFFIVFHCSSLFFAVFYRFFYQFSLFFIVFHRLLSFFGRFSLVGLMSLEGPTCQRFLGLVHSFLGPIRYNIWWENSKRLVRTYKWSKIALFYGFLWPSVSRFGIFHSFLSFLTVFYCFSLFFIIFNCPLSYYGCTS